MQKRKYSRLIAGALVFLMIFSSTDLTLFATEEDMPSQEETSQADIEESSTDCDEDCLIDVSEDEEPIDEGIGTDDSDIDDSDETAEPEDEFFEENELIEEDEFSEDIEDVAEESLTDEICEEEMASFEENVQGIDLFFDESAPEHGTIMQSGSFYGMEWTAYEDGSCYVRGKFVENISNPLFTEPSQSANYDEDGYYVPEYGLNY
ncbi:MAG: hypothetical protein MJ119_07720, partial [Lachnospiraceae bacterium]|nr:hypothetical protein [Lachnospiraceae bacterium]